MLKLIIEDDEGRKTVVPFVRDEITIGRQEGNTIRLTERNVSRRHARLVRQNGHVLVEDLGSYNGIRINGDKIQGQVPVHEGDLIQIGDYDLAVQSEQAAQAAAGQTTPSSMQATSPILPVNGGAPNGTNGEAETAERATQRSNAAAQAMTVKLPDLNATSPALPVVSDAGATMSGEDDEGPEEADPDDVQSASGESETGRRQSTAIIRMDQVEGNRPRQVVDLDPSEAPRLVVLNTEFAGREFACIRTELKIGRIEDNDIALDHRSLSRTHCKIVREDTGEWRVVDMQSANGLMVNGEPYAQSALRSGDTLELGHVKFKFVGPGESFTLAPSAEGVAVKQSGGSKLPMMAGGALVVVALLGAVYWFVLRKKPPPPKPVVDDVTDTVEVKPETKPPEDLTPEEQNKERAKKLALANVAIEELQWDKATEILNNCFVGESVCPEATTLLGQMNQERAMKNALEKAEQALDDEKLDEARTQLNLASASKLLTKRYQRAAGKLRELTSRELAAKTATAKPEVKPEVKPDPPPKADPPPKPAPVDASMGLLEEGKKLMRDKQYPAAKTMLEKCVKANPKNADCHKLLGTAWAKLGDPEKGAREYKEFVKLAPPDHPDLDKVKAIISAYENSK